MLSSLILAASALAQFSVTSSTNSVLRVISITGPNGASSTLKPTLYVPPRDPGSGSDHYKLYYLTLQNNGATTIDLCDFMFDGYVYNPANNQVRNPVPVGICAGGSNYNYGVPTLYSGRYLSPGVQTQVVIKKVPFYPLSKPLFPNAKD